MILNNTNNDKEDKWIRIYTNTDFSSIGRRSTNTLPVNVYEYTQLLLVTTNTGGWGRHSTLWMIDNSANMTIFTSGYYNDSSSQFSMTRQFNFSTNNGKNFEIDYCYKENSSGTYDGGMIPVAIYVK